MIVYTTFAEKIVASHNVGSVSEGGIGGSEGDLKRTLANTLSLVAAAGKKGVLLPLSPLKSNDWVRSNR